MRCGAYRLGAASTGGALQPPSSANPESTAPKSCSDSEPRARPEVPCPIQPLNRFNLWIDSASGSIEHWAHSALAALTQRRAGHALRRLRIRSGAHSTAGGVGSSSGAHSALTALRRRVSTRWCRHVSVVCPLPGSAAGEGLVRCFATLPPAGPCALLQAYVEGRQCVALLHSTARYGQHSIVHTHTHTHTHTHPRWRGR